MNGIAADWTRKHAHTSRSWGVDGIEQSVLVSLGPLFTKVVDKIGPDLIFLMMFGDAKGWRSNLTL